MNFCGIFTLPEKITTFFLVFFRTFYEMIAIRASILGSITDSIKSNIEKKACAFYKEMLSELYQQKKKLSYSKEYTHMR